MSPWCRRCTRETDCEEEIAKMLHRRLHDITITNYNSKLTNYKLQITNYKLQITNYNLQITNYKLQGWQFNVITFKSCDEFFLDGLCLDRNLRKSFEICMSLSNIPMNRDIPFEAAHLMRACLCPNPNTRLTLSEVKRLC